MKIDLSAINFTGEDAANYRVRYARIDNTTTPVFNIAGYPTAAQFPYSISNVDNGQYVIGITSIYADLRNCEEHQEFSDPCQSIIALNAVQVGSNIQVTYTAPSEVPQVYLTVNYPNGGSFTGTYTNGANNSTILVPIPSGVNGNYNIYMQSVCDPDTHFYSASTPPVIVNIGSNTTQIVNNGAGVTLIGVYGISGYTLNSPLSTGNSDSGIHNTFTGSISIPFSGTPTVATNAILSINGIDTSCQDLPNTSGGSITFGSLTYYSTDIIKIVFATGTCF